MAPKVFPTMVFLVVMALSPTVGTAQEDDPLAPSNFKAPIAKQIAANLKNPQKLKQLTVGFVDTSKSRLSCKLAVFPMYEMVMRFQASGQQLQASMEQTRNMLQSKGIKTDDFDRSQAEAQMQTAKTFQKETQIRLDQIDEYCGG